MIAPALLAAGMAPASVVCPAERAQYTLRGESSVTAGFTQQRYQINYASKLFFWIRTSDRQRWWFSINAPNGSGGVFISPDVDATKITAAEHEVEAKGLPAEAIEVDFDTFDRNYNVTDNPPQLGDAAPAHLFARGLGALLWYNPVGAANRDRTAKSFSVPIAMFDFTDCTDTSTKGAKTPELGSLYLSASCGRVTLPLPYAIAEPIFRRTSTAILAGSAGD